MRIVTATVSPSFMSFSVRTEDLIGNKYVSALRSNQMEVPHSAPSMLTHTLSLPQPNSSLL